MQEVVCMAVLSKSQMSEEDIKFHYITPAITAKWNNQHLRIGHGLLQSMGNRMIVVFCFNNGNRIIRAQVKSAPLALTNFQRKKSWLSGTKQAQTMELV